MKALILDNTKTVMQNPANVHNYFAWPSAARLKNGVIAVAASGFRMAHVCPFGKTVMAVSTDEGETFTQPFPVINTSLDDRDAGLCPFGKSGLIVTSFNNSVAFQRTDALKHIVNEAFGPKKAYADAYLDTVTPEMEARDLGSLFRVSFDNGVTFGEIFKSPITSPHGPIELADGSVLWVGKEYGRENETIKAYGIDVLTGKCTYKGEIERIFTEDDELYPCEPYAAQMPDGRIICHIRAQRRDKGKSRILTLYQSESSDMGRTWSKPERIIGMTEGAPSHLLVHSSGVVICSYGHRTADPYFGIRAIFSTDNGRTWSEPEVICESPDFTGDMGYPASVELRDGSIFTAFYAHPEKGGPAVILSQHWKLA